MCTCASGQGTVPDLGDGKELLMAMHVRRAGVALYLVRKETCSRLGIAREFTYGNARESGSALRPCVNVLCPECIKAMLQ